MRANPLKLVFAVLAGLYFLWCAWNPHTWRLLDGVNLLIHEAGHLFFRPLGEFMMMAGGSLFQVIMPTVFVGYFIRQRQLYSAALVLFWVGQSILNVSVYAGDALAMQLPLVGGEIHDWNYLLGQLGMLKATPKVAGFIRLLGALVILGAFLWALREAWTSSDNHSNAKEEEFTQSTPDPNWWLR